MDSQQWGGDDWEIWTDFDTGPRQLTDNGNDDVYPQIDLNRLVWQQWDGNDWEIWIDFATGPRQLTYNGNDDVDPQIDLNRLVWQQWDGNDWEIWTDFDTGPRQLTDNDNDDVDPQIDLNRLVWQQWDGNDWEIWTDFDTGPRQLTDNGKDDVDPQIDLNRLVWQQWDGHDWEIWTDFDTGPRQLTDNGKDDVDPQIDLNRLVWQQWDGNDWEIWTDFATGPRQLTDNGNDDVDPQIDLNRLVWQQWDGNDWEIWTDFDTGPRQLTDNGKDDVDPQIDLNRLVWQQGVLPSVVDRRIFYNNSAFDAGEMAEELVFGNCEDAPVPFMTNTFTDAMCKGTQVDISVDTTITRFAVFNHLETAADLRFFVLEVTGEVTYPPDILLYEGPDTRFPADTAGYDVDDFSWKMSGEFSLPLLAGKSYVLGAIPFAGAPGGAPVSAVPIMWTVHSQNGITDVLSSPVVLQLVSDQDYFLQTGYGSNGAIRIYSDQQDDDNAAIATDKAALLPGQTATPTNYTNYGKGINGILVDIASLPGTPTADDFEFKTGNHHDSANWAPLTTPPTIAVRPGEGTGNSDRITITWPDNTIQNTWLEITVLATANTGLSEPDVFYFGNAVGESGNSGTDARVNAIDSLLACNNPRTLIDPAPVDFPYDFNRDQRVNATDMLIVRNSQTHFLNALNLITVPDGSHKSFAARLDVGDDVAIDAAFGQETEDANAKLHWFFELDDMVTERQASEKVVEDAVILLLAGV